METLIIFFGSIIVGALVGFLGLGGGVFIVPLLTIFVGMPVKQAVSISLIAVVTSSMSASTVYLKKGLVELESGIILAMTATAGGATGAYISGFVSNNFIAFLFAGVLIYSATSILLRGDKKEQRSLSQNRNHMTLFMIVGFFAGVMTGLVGLGGGVVFVPLLYVGLGLPITLAMGTSVFSVGLAATAGAIIYFLRGEITPVVSILPAVVVGIVIGAKIGGWIGVKAKSIYARALFAIVLLYLSYRMILVGLER